MSKQLRCRVCRRELTGPLQPSVLPPSDSPREKEPFVPVGQLCVSDGNYYTDSAGKYLVNLDDRRNLSPHRDPRRLNGCCGLDGHDGLNQVCACGAEVATECSDCWMAHALIFEAEAVDLVDASDSAS